VQTNNPYTITNIKPADHPNTSLMQKLKTIFKSQKKRKYATIKLIQQNKKEGLI